MHARPCRISGLDPANGKPYKPTWEPKSNCTNDLIQAWKDHKAAERQRRLDEAANDSSFDPKPNGSDINGKTKRKRSQCHSSLIAISSRLRSEVNLVPRTSVWRHTSPAGADSPLLLRVPSGPRLQRRLRQFRLSPRSRGSPGAGTQRHLRRRRPGSGSCHLSRRLPPSRPSGPRRQPVQTRKAQTRATHLASVGVRIRARPRRPPASSPRRTPSTATKTTRTTRAQTDRPTCLTTTCSTRMRRSHSRL